MVGYGGIAGPGYQPQTTDTEKPMQFVITIERDEDGA